MTRLVAHRTKNSSTGQEECKRYIETGGASRLWRNRPSSVTVACIARSSLEKVMDLLPPLFTDVVICSTVLYLVQGPTLRPCSCRSSGWTTKSGRAAVAALDVARDSHTF